jgi:N-acetyl-anhydromuramyl-L-alanine amidase AmpD
MPTEAADYPSATFVPAAAGNYRRALRATWSKVVIHVTDGHPDARPVAEMWQVPGHGSSAHFVIGQDGEVIQAVPLRDVAFHAHAANEESVGIEHCARSPREWGRGDAGMPTSDAQYRASAKLVAWLCAVAGLPPTRATIRGHAEADPKTTHTDCPTGAFDFARFMPLVEAEHAALLKGAQ